MDEMKIESKFMRTVISKLASAMLGKKIGYNVDIQLNSLNVTIVEGKTHVHLDVAAELNKGELLKILKNIGVEES